LGRRAPSTACRGWSTPSTATTTPTSGWRPRRHWAASAWRRAPDDERDPRIEAALERATDDADERVAEAAELALDDVAAAEEDHMHARDW
jgi:hypothetical protein